MAKDTDIFLSVRVRRDDQGKIYSLITGTILWVEADEMILQAIRKEDFRKWNDGTIGWMKSPKDGIEYALVNLRD